MKKISTLIYFVNNCQAECESILCDSGDQQIENFLTEMDGKEKVPSEAVIENILNFARSYEVLETKQTGYVEMNLN